MYLFTQSTGKLNVILFNEGETRSLKVRQQNSDTDNVYINVFLFDIIVSDHMKCHRNSIGQQKEKKTTFSLPKGIYFSP